MNEINGQHITGGQSKAFLFPVDVFGKIDGEPIVACDRIILAGDYEVIKVDDDEFEKNTSFSFEVKMTKALKRELHPYFKKPRLPRKQKKMLKKQILIKEGCRKVIFRVSSTKLLYGELIR